MADTNSLMYAGLLRIKAIVYGYAGNRCISKIPLLSK
jgi:hypothetical protein